MYKVVKAFADMQDGNYIYGVGDTYPHSEDVVVSVARVNELSTDNNRLREPLIEAIPDEKSEPEPETEPEKKPRRRKEK